MIKNNFNQEFTGFKDNEDILLDTGVVLALINKYDAWHSTIKSLFENYIFNEESNVFLYVHSGIVNEVTHLSDKPLSQYISKHKGSIVTEEDIKEARDATILGIRELIDKEYVSLLISDKNSILKQIDYSLYFGSNDSLSVSLLDGYGISLLTVDNRLVDNIENIKQDFPNIQTLYYTKSNHKDY